MGEGDGGWCWVKLEVLIEVDVEQYLGLQCSAWKRLWS